MLAVEYKQNSGAGISSLRLLNQYQHEGASHSIRNEDRLLSLRGRQCSRRRRWEHLRVVRYEQPSLSANVLADTLPLIHEVRTMAHCHKSSSGDHPKPAAIPKTHAEHASHMSAYSKDVMRKMECHSRGQHAEGHEHGHHHADHHDDREGQN